MSCVSRKTSKPRPLSRSWSWTAALRELHPSVAHKHPALAPEKADTFQERHGQLQHLRIIGSAAKTISSLEKGGYHGAKIASSRYGWDHRQARSVGATRQLLVSLHRAAEVGRRGCGVPFALVKGVPDPDHDVATDLQIEIGNELRYSRGECVAVGIRHITQQADLVGAHVVSSAVGASCWPVRGWPLRSTPRYCWRWRHKRPCYQLRSGP